MFGAVLITICTLMHLYVAWRVTTIPAVKRHLPGWLVPGMFLLLWLVFFSGRTLGHHGTGPVAIALEFVGMNWMAALFLIFISLLTVDILTLWGFLLQRTAPILRGVALIAGCALSTVGLVQGMRPPVVETYNVHLKGLPADLDGATLVAVSDLHLGSLLGKNWLSARIDQIMALQPDMVVFLGDIFEGHGHDGKNLVSVMKRLHAQPGIPLGVWGVTGNHAFYGDDNSAIELITASGIYLLRDCWVEVCPGLVLAGVDDLTVGRRRSGQENANQTSKDAQAIKTALDNRPYGATILLSHTPWHADQAAHTGVGLMLSGHTHGGQIWPFDYLVRLRYPLLEGQYVIDNMTVLVCRGTGAWGPRMRLWSPGEIMHITLHTHNKTSGNNDQPPA